MRFLKKKIELKQKYLNEKDILPTNLKTEVSLPETADSECSSIQEVLLPIRKPRQKPPCPEGNSKNIVKNYGKALCAFSSSTIAIPYLENLIRKRGFSSIKVTDYMTFIKTKKEGINSIESLRKLLVSEEQDSQEMKAYKKLFQDASIIFLKYFSVNWIFSGKLMHKNAHLKFRFKMLRRVQDPEHFTYLKTSAK